MADGLEPLILDLVEWVAKDQRTYAEVMDAWRTSCPRLTVWEDAVDRQLVARQRSTARNDTVTITDEGRRLLERSGRWASPPM